MAGSALGFETFSSSLADAALEWEWTALAERTLAPAWSWPGWFAAWERAFSSEQPLVVYGARVEGRLAAIGVFRWRRGCLQAAANVHSPSFGLVGESGEARQAVIDAALADRPREIQCCQLLEGEADEQAFVRAASARRYKLLRTGVERAPFVEVGVDWEGYTRSHPGRVRMKELRRRRRRLAERGSVSFEWLSPTPDDVERLLADGLRVEASGWKNRSGSAILSVPGTASFYGEIARWAVDQGWLRFAFLRLDGRAIAFEYAFEKEGVVSLLKGGYGESFASSGPGILLLHDELERAFHAGVNEVDLLGGSDAFKMPWADGTRVKATVTAFAPTLGGRAAFLRRWCELRARRAVRRALRERQPRRRHSGVGAPQRSTFAGFDSASRERASSGEPPLP